MGHAHRKRNMADDEARLEEERNFCKTFYSMAENVSQLLSRLEKVEEKNHKNKVQHMEMVEKNPLLLLP